MTPEGLEQIYQQAVRHHQAGRLAAAEALYRQLLAERPDTPEILILLGHILEDTHRSLEAAEVFQRVVLLRPADADSHVSLGNAHRQLGNLDAAIDAFSGAIALRPNFAGALNNLGNALWDTGNLPDAMHCFRQAASFGDDSAAAGNCLFALHFDPAITPHQLRAEHVHWNQRFAQALAPSPSAHPNNPDPNRRLRVGYVSPDLRNHPVGLFMLPLLAHHDRDAFEVFCYSDAHPDALTHRLAALAPGWRETTRFTDAQLAGQIRNDQIDILIDLTLHSRGSRLLAFARKPAPVQATYLGYCSTTGLEAMDYRLSDPWLDPAGSDESVYSERTIRLPRTYWCYQPILDLPLAGPLPALASGSVTFGCLNNFYKISASALAAWQELLAGVPNSHLILHAHRGAHRQHLLDRFAAAGIDPSRIEFIGAQSLAGYFETYKRIDIALDPFPFPGATTTLDALWSGVPVVSLAGQTAVARAGLSILSNVGLPQWVARDRCQYVSIAATFAGKLDELAALRAALRGMMRSSPLTDASGFARDVESAFGQMWQRWCGSR